MPRKLWSHGIGPMIFSPLRISDIVKKMEKGSSEDMELCQWQYRIQLDQHILVSMEIPFPHPVRPKQRLRHPLSAVYSFTPARRRQLQLNHHGNAGIGRIVYSSARQECYFSSY